ncbi:MAG: hypothetical protein K8R58_01425, partial [Bacteroidales bacterium]|nr:hypothetical protein [Bacteroidales bacterium]
MSEVPNDNTILPLVCLGSFPLCQKDSTYFLDINIFTEGAYNGGMEMSTFLNINDFLPVNQPFSGEPWNYQGTETLDSIPNENVTDWVLVELRETNAEAHTATPLSIIHKQAALLLNDGSIVGLDGTSILSFNHCIIYNLFVVIWHRNHLGVMSANPLTESEKIYTYDFYSGEAQVYGGANAHKELETSIWGMIASDGKADLQINNDDKNEVWQPSAGNSGYEAGDFNLDGQVNNNDKIQFWEINAGLASQVPGGYFFNCGEVLIDPRDGQYYTTVEIENQCWMAENLNIGTMIYGYKDQLDNSIIEKYCYHNDTSLCDEYGGLYQWNEMMQYTSEQGTQGICPPGWHLPTDDEWKILEGAVDSIYGIGDPEWDQMMWRGYDAGGNLKETGYIHWADPNYGATNSSKFTVLPAGSRFYDGTAFYWKHLGTFFWTSTDFDNEPFGRSLSFTKKTIFRYNYPKTMGNS